MTFFFLLFGFYWTDTSRRVVGNPKTVVYEAFGSKTRKVKCRSIQPPPGGLVWVSKEAQSKQLSLQVQLGVSLNIQVFYFPKQF